MLVENGKKIFNQTETLGINQMQYNRSWLLVFFLSFNSFAENALIEKANEFIADYKAYSKQLIINLHCDDYQSIFEKSDWTRIVELFFGKHKEKCCVIKDYEALDLQSSEYDLIRKKSSFLFSELSKRVSFDEFCDINWFMAELSTFKNDVAEILKCQNDTSCTEMKRKKLISMCQISAYNMNKSLKENSLASEVQTCLITNLNKPVIEKNNEIKTSKIPAALDPHFDDLFFTDLNTLKNKINNNISINELDEISDLVVNLRRYLNLLWVVSRKNPKSFKLNNPNESHLICNTFDMSSSLSLIDIIAKSIKDCMVSSKCSQETTHRMFDDLLKEKSELVTMFIDSKEFKNCMYDFIGNNSK
jgi:hypothetical protein